mgnify:CR=1 FL=1
MPSLHKLHITLLTFLARASRVAVDSAIDDADVIDSAHEFTAVSSDLANQVPWRSPQLHTELFGSPRDKPDRTRMTLPLAHADSPSRSFLRHASTTRGPSSCDERLGSYGTHTQRRSPRCTLPSESRPLPSIRVTGTLA